MKQDVVVGHREAVVGDDCAFSCRVAFACAAAARQMLEHLKIARSILTRRLSPLGCCASNNSERKGVRPCPSLQTPRPPSSRAARGQSIRCGRLSSSRQEARPRDVEGAYRDSRARSKAARCRRSRHGRRGELTTFDETRDGHVQAPDFFDSERYPELRFVSTAVQTRGEQLVVEGEVTIRTHETVELKGSFVGAGVDPYGNDRIGLELAGTVDRTSRAELERAASSGGFLLPNEVVLRANLAAVKAADVKVLAISAASGRVDNTGSRPGGCRPRTRRGRDRGVHGLGLLPHYNGILPGGRRHSAPVTELRRRIDEATRCARGHARVQRSTTGVLKNAVDWVSARLASAAGSEQDRRASPALATGEYGAIWAQQSLRRILGIAGARVVATTFRCLAPTRRSTSRGNSRALWSPNGSAPTSLLRARGSASYHRA